MTRITAWRSAGSTPADFISRVIPVVTNAPGETVLTRISSFARDCERFFVTLVTIAFAAVYATRAGVWRFVEIAETFTIRAHSAARSNGSAARTQRIIPSAA